MVDPDRLYRSGVKQNRLFLWKSTLSGTPEEKPMHDWDSLWHVRWDCKCHVVIVPKYRKRALYGKLKQDTGEILRDLARQKGIEILEGHLMPDHIDMCLKIPPI